MDAPESCGSSENLALEFIGRGVHTVSLRFAPAVHGAGDHGFIAAIAAMFREKGVSGYPGNGTNRWAAWHRSDAGRLVALGLAKAPAGARLHAGAEEDVRIREIAKAIGRALGLPVTSIALDDVQNHFGWIGTLFGTDLAATSAGTREFLGREPTGPALVEGIDAGAYSARARPRRSSVGMQGEVLVIDQDRSVREELTTALEARGYRVDSAGDITAALHFVAERKPDVIALDVSLPDTDCFDMVKLRSRAKAVPILFLTARQARTPEWEDELRLGGDDYIAKPFRPEDAEIQLRSLLHQSAGDHVLRYQDLELNERLHTVQRGGTKVDLSPTEFRLLHFLLQHQGTVVSRSQILRAVWHYDFGGRSLVVERFISNLRSKLGPGDDHLIHTVRGVGYRLGD